VPELISDPKFEITLSENTALFPIFLSVVKNELPPIDPITTEF
jgi:hypothetical protein